MKPFDDIVKFHGHSCPGLALGYRVAIAALKELQMDGMSEDEEIVAIVENDSCAVDAVQVVTGCTFGKGNLIFRDYGKQAYTFIKRPSGDAVRISIDFQPLAESVIDKEMWRRYSEGDRSREVIESVHNRKTKKIQSILNSPDTELLNIKRVRLEPPPEAEIYTSLRCEMCGEKVAEPKARIKSGKTLCIPCFIGKGSGFERLCPKGF